LTTHNAPYAIRSLGLRLRDGKGFFPEESLQSSFKSNKSDTVANVKWYRVPDGSSRMSEGAGCNRSRSRSDEKASRSTAQRIGRLLLLQYTAKSPVRNSTFSDTQASKFGGLEVPWSGRLKHNLYSTTGAASH